MVESKVKSFIIKQQMIPPNSHIVLGISGGPDSMVLLEVMNNLRGDMGFTLSVAHVHHLLRPEADEEAALVEETCTRLGLPFYLHQADVAKKANQEKKSTEEAGREVRYHFFSKLLMELKADLAATAHHQDDNAETVLLHLLRGTGIKGLRGIMPINGHIIRPLLEVSRLEIEAYLKEHNLSYFIDKSNYDETYLRNKVRHSLMPLLKQDYNPRLVESLNQLAVIAREENEFFELEVQKVLPAVIKHQDTNYISINNLLLIKLPIALQKRVILKVLAILAGDTGWEAIVLDLMTKSGSSKTVYLKKSVNIAKIYDELVFSTCKKEIISYDYELNIPTTISLPTGDKYLIDLVKADEFQADDYDLYLDYDKCSLPLHLRSRQMGDVFYPYGLAGSKKIKDFFIDAKVPRYKRNDIPLLASAAGDIYAILGYRISDLVKVDADTRRVLTFKTVE